MQLKTSFQKGYLILFCLFIHLFANAQTSVFNNALKEANSGDPQSQIALGEFYFNGTQGVSIDYEKAFNWITKGLSNPKNLKDAIRAEGNNYLGIMYLNGFYTSKDISKAIYYFKEAAKLGDGNGWYNQGLISRYGLDGKSNPSHAYMCFKEAAEKDIMGAIFELGYCYHTGLGVEKDLEAAKKWYKKGVEKGNVLSMVNLANIYFFSSGEDQDVKEAHRLWKIAEAEGNELAKKSLQVLYNRPKLTKAPSNKKKEGENGLYGLFTENGIELLPYEYSSISWFDGVYKIKRGVYEGIATAEGIVLIKPDKYTYIEHAGRGFMVHIGGSRGFAGCTDNSGKVIIPPDKFQWACHHGKDINVVKSNGHTGVYNDAGKEVFMTNFTYLKCYMNNDGSFAYYQTSIENDTIRLDSLGKTSTPFVMKKTKKKFKANYDGKYYYWVTDVNGKYGMEDANHHVILPCNYDDISIISGRLRATQNEYNGIFSLSGEPIIPMGKYHDVVVVDSTYHHYTPFYRVWFRDKVGVCDIDGNEIISPTTYTSITAWTLKNLIDADFKVSKGDFHGIIKKNGEVVLPVKYTSYALHSRSSVNKSPYFDVGIYGKQGLCDSLGHEIVSPKYDLIIPIESYDLPNDYFRIYLGDKEGIIRDDGTVIIEPNTYDFVSFDKYKYGDKLGQIYILAENEEKKYNYSIQGEYLGEDKREEYKLAEREKLKQFNLFFQEAHRKFEIQKYSAAIKSYKKALEYIEDDVAYYNIGAAYYNQNNYKKAIEYLEKCIKISQSETTIADAKKLIRESHDYWEQKKERRSQIALSILGTAVGVGLAALSQSQNNNSYSNGNKTTGLGRDTSMDYLLDPRYAMMQVQQEYYNEYLQMTNGGQTMTYEEWFQKIKGPALAEQYNIEHGGESGTDDDSSSVSTSSSDNSSGSSNSNGKMCRLCAGTGWCKTCEGKGYFYNSFDLSKKVLCPNCHNHPGKCSSCGGTGYK